MPEGCPALLWEKKLTDAVERDVPVFPNAKRKWLSPRNVNTGWRNALKDPVHQGTPRKKLRGTVGTAVAIVEDRRRRPIGQTSR